MTAYTGPAYYHDSSSCKLYENQNSFSAVELAFARFEKLLAVTFVICVAGRSLMRWQALPELFTGKLALLDLHRCILHGYGCVSGMLEYCRVFLVYITSRFPLNPDKVNVWFVSKENLNESDIHIINLDNDGWKNRKLSPLDHVEFPNGLADERHKLYFHGTSHEAAVDIMKNGIDLNLSTKHGDFSTGKGFYVFDEFKTAFEWAGSRYNNYSLPAVLVFRVDKNRFDAYNGENLLGGKMEKKWQRVVQTCRLAGMELKMKNVDFIEGPTATISKNTPWPEKHSYQLCIVSDDMADYFDNCLHAVVFRSP